MSIQLRGFTYVGYPVEDLVNLEEEDVIYLLLFKELPSPEQSDKFRAELALRGESLPTGALRVLESLTSRSGHPMDWLVIGIMALGTAEATGDIRSDSVRI